MSIRGQVKWFDPKKGFGFIVGPEGQDVFVHYSHIEAEGFRSLKDGEWVEYELVEGEKGWQARAAKAIASDSAPPTDAPPSSAPDPGSGSGPEPEVPDDPGPPVMGGYEGADDS